LCKYDILKAILWYLVVLKLIYITSFKITQKLIFQITILKLSKQLFNEQIAVNNISYRLKKKVFCFIEYYIAVHIILPK